MITSLENPENARQITTGPGCKSESSAAVIIWSSALQRRLMQSSAPLMRPFGAQLERSHTGPATAASFKTPNEVSNTLQLCDAFIHTCNETENQFSQQKSQKSLTSESFGWRSFFLVQITSSVSNISVRECVCQISESYGCAELLPYPCKSHRVEGKCAEFAQCLFILNDSSQIYFCIHRLHSTTAPCWESSWETLRERPSLLLCP